MAQDAQQAAQMQTTDQHLAPSAAAALQDLLVNY
jgi:hypothetical protein